MAAVGFDLYSRLLLSEAVEHKARHEAANRSSQLTGAVLDLPRMPTSPTSTCVPDEAQKLESFHRRLASGGASRRDVAAFRQGGTPTGSVLL